MANKPVLGADGKPLLATDGKPMICEVDRSCCNSPGCSATFTSTKLSPTQWQFTDTSPGAHTRQWTTEDGGSSTSSPWTHTFPTTRLYWVDLTVTYPGDITCTTRKFIGDFVPCDYCRPAELGETVYITVGPGGNDGLGVCQKVTPMIPGTYAATAQLSGGCNWGTDYYFKTRCWSCSQPVSDEQNHGVFVNAAVSYAGPFQKPTEIHFTAGASCGSSSTSTDCNGYSGGGGANYRKIVPVGPPLYRTQCVGQHTLFKELETPGPKYFKWPETVLLNIPGQ